jgi:surface antigen
MNSKLRVIFFILVFSSSLVGCNGTGKTIGGGVGAAIGAAAGRHITKGKDKDTRREAMLAGAFLGGTAGMWIGEKIEKYYWDSKDSKTAHKILETGSTGQLSNWRNPDTNSEYSITPTSTVVQANGEPCREYDINADINGEIEKGKGKACRNPDGTWDIVN